MEMEIEEKVNEISEYVDELPQQKLFLTMLSEHVLSFSMNLFKIKKEKGEEERIENIKEEIKIFSKIMDETILMLKEEKKNSNRNEKQGEYLFFKESSKDIMKIQNYIKEIRYISKKCGFILRANHYHSFTGNLSIKDVCTNFEQISLIGNEHFIGRDGQLGNTISQLSSSNAKIRLCFINGTLGSGKTNFTRSMFCYKKYLLTSYFFCCRFNKSIN